MMTAFSAGLRSSIRASAASSSSLGVDVALANDRGLRGRVQPLEVVRHGGDATQRRCAAPCGQPAARNARARRRDAGAARAGVERPGRSTPGEAPLAVPTSGDEAPLAVPTGASRLGCRSPGAGRAAPSGAGGLRRSAWRRQRSPAERSRGLGDGVQPDDAAQAVEVERRVGRGVASRTRAVAHHRFDGTAGRAKPRIPGLLGTSTPMSSVARAEASPPLRRGCAARCGRRWPRRRRARRHPDARSPTRGRGRRSVSARPPERSGTGRRNSCWRIADVPPFTAPPLRLASSASRLTGVSTWRPADGDREPGRAPLDLGLDAVGEALAVARAPGAGDAVGPASPTHRLGHVRVRPRRLGARGRAGRVRGRRSDRR